MVTYVATCESYGFRGRYWEKGQKVELQAGEKVPEHFVCLDKAPEAPVVEEPNQESEIADPAQAETEPAPSQEPEAKPKPKPKQARAPRAPKQSS